MNHNDSNSAALGVNRVADALSGMVIVNIGQVSPAEQSALNKAVRAGKLAKWRGHWHPVAGAPFGIGPLKTCWGLPAIAEHFASFRAKA